MTGWRRQDGDDRVGDLFCEASSVSTPGLATRPDWPLRRAPPQASRIAKIWWGTLGAPSPKRPIGPCGQTRGRNE
jgi:hypothetical protein